MKRRFAVLMVAVGLLSAVCAGRASAAVVSAKSAVLGPGDLVGLNSLHVSSAPWLGLFAGRLRHGEAITELFASPAPKGIKVISRAVVASNARVAARLESTLRRAPGSQLARVDAGALRVRVSLLRGASRVVWRGGPVVGELVAAGGPESRGSRLAFIQRLEGAVRQRVQAVLTQSPWEALLARISTEGGKTSVRTALEAFAVAIAPLPGVRAPHDATTRRGDGTLALSLVFSVWSRLSAAERSAITRAIGVPIGSGGAASLTRPVARAASLVPSTDPVIISTINQAVAFFARTTGVTIRLPILPFIDTAAGSNYEEGLDANGATRTSLPVMRCRVVFVKVVPARETIAHEVFHCLQNQLLGSENATEVAPRWVIEGSASFAGCSFDNNDPVPGITWQPYLTRPDIPLLNRSYAAIGFYALARQSGVNMLAAMPAVITAPSDAAAYQAAVSNQGKAVLDQWASSYFRMPSRGHDWDVAGPCVPPNTATFRAAPGVLVPDRAYPYAVPAYTVAYVELDTSQSKVDVIRVTGSGSGNTRVWGRGVDDQHVTSDYYCIAKDGCRCPRNEQYVGPPTKDLPPSPTPAIAVTGGQGGQTGTIEPIKKQCRRGTPKPPPKIPRCPTLRAHEICFVFDGSVTGRQDQHPYGHTGVGNAQAHLVWIAHWPDYNGLQAIVRSRSTASGQADIVWDHDYVGTPPADCHVPLGLTANSSDTNLFNPSRGAGKTYARFIVPFFGAVVVARCPGQAGSTFPDGYPAQGFTFGSTANTDLSAVDFYYYVVAGKTTTKDYSRTYRSGDGVFSSSWSGRLTSVVGPGTYG